MTESNINELIESINNLNKFSWGDLISLLSLIAAWITIFFLLKEKISRGRPYLQVSVELVRSSLACIVVKNVGEVPLTLNKITFDEDFLKQLPEKESKMLKNNKVTNLIIQPNSKWIFCLGVIIPDILNKYDKKIVNVSYIYKKIGGIKKYKETSDVDFEQISNFLVYISEIDELKQTNEKIVKNTNEINKKLKQLETEVVTYTRVKETMTNNIVAPKLK